MERRKLVVDQSFKPFPVYNGDEIFRNGIFLINITKILKDIEEGGLDVSEVVINVEDWFKWHFHSTVNEDHLSSVDVTIPVLQVEFKPGDYKIIDGNHRLEKGYRESVPFMKSYRMTGEQLLPYFKNVESYERYVGYWNSKLE